MVRRVRPGRRDALPPARSRVARWAGPPPLLILATLAGFLVAPLVDDEPTAPRPALSVVSAPVLSPQFVEPQVARRQVLAPTRGGHASIGVKPVRLKPVHVGVASMNMFRQLSAAQAAQDARALTSREGVDVVGWQEAHPFAGVLRALPGWDTQTFRIGSRITELAVSWRRDDFRLVSARQHRVADGVGYEEGRYPFANRLVAVVTLEHRATGRLLTVINTHLPQKIENLDQPGSWEATINAFRARAQLARLASTWKHVPGRWIVGTGDFNFDAGSDARRQPAGGPRQALGDVAASSYQRLGRDVAATFPEHGRQIDYVWADRAGLASGQIRFTRHWVLGGLNSDHNALVARLRLS